MLRSAIAGCLLLATAPCYAGDVQIDGRKFRIADGFELSLAATQPLVDRPITAAFDEQGRLYVADSSGSNDNVQQQLKERPHRIVRLEDLDGDGRFDTSVVFADRMMFPEGTMWFDGSLYVAAPPSIWKLTDTNQDGVADRREEWFEGKTLTGCANDLHGPYLGPDGWIYWCKGAFAEQHYERPGKSPFTTRAAHIFRRRPEGGPVEPVMTGGMDNPVDVVFTPGGERIFTTTFLQHPRGGKRDGLIHALYGGLYGKVHGVIDSHPRTGDLLTPVVHLGAAAPCGLHRLESDQFGGDYEDNIFAALFNMQKVTRHVLRRSGATFEATTEDFLATDDIDFHPTDIVEDADGSLLVIDTGGWYKLCCPTSQLHKPDVLGDIYRIRRVQAHQNPDPRGTALVWESQDPSELTRRLDDNRPAVRRQAQAQLAELGVASIDALDSVSRNGTATARLQAVWTLCRIDGAQARASIRSALTDTDTTVQQAAVHAVSVHRDAEAVSGLRKLVENGTPHVRRAAAEALGRIGDPDSIPTILAAVATCSSDRALEHSLIYALIEIDRPKQVYAGLSRASAVEMRAALIAVDQMESGGLDLEDVEPLFDDKHQELRDVAWWLVGRHPEWGAGLTNYFGRVISGKATPDKLDLIRKQLPRLLKEHQLLELIYDRLGSGSLDTQFKLAMLDAIAGSSVQSWPAHRSAPLIDLLSAEDSELVTSAVAVIHQLEKTKPDAGTIKALLQVAHRPKINDRARLQALAVRSRNSLALDRGTHEFICANLTSDKPPEIRALAVEVLQGTPMDREALSAIAEAIPEVGPMELVQLLGVFQRTPTAEVGVSFIDALQKCPAASALSSEQVAECLESFPDSIADHKDQLFTSLAAARQEKSEQIDRVISLLDHADIRRGQSIFNSSKASCRACHEMGYLGGDVGPDLTRIGRIRTERDLLEAILFPSVSFVRSYEPVEVLTTHGKVISGLVRDETESELILALDAQKLQRIRHEDIEMRRPGRVSVMPAGLEKQLKNQELADLVKFLRAAR